MIWKKKTDDKTTAFEGLFRQQYPPLVRHATQLLGDPEEARDVVGEAMEQAWQRWDTLAEAQRASWLFTTVRHLALNRLKHRQVVTDHAVAIREATVFDLQARYWEHERLLRQAEAVVEALGEPTRTIIRLCYFEQNTYRVAAERLGISPDTVKKHISKALRALREALGKKGDER